MSNYGAINNFGNPAYQGAPGFSENQSPLSQAVENTRTLNSIVARLDKSVSLLNTNQDSESLRAEIKQLRESSVLLIRDTAVLLQRPVSASEKPLQTKTIQEFTEIVSKCKNISQASLQKENAFPLRNNYNPSYEDQRAGRANDLRMQQLEQQVPQDIQFEVISEIQIDNKIIQERNQGLHTINKQLIDLKEVTIDVAKIVEANDPMLSYAEKDTAAASSISKNATSALEGALKSQKRSRNKVCCAVLAVIIGIIIVALIIGVFVGVG